MVRFSCAASIAILPIAIVTISEHIGDHTVLGQICGQFLKEPGLHHTLLGDGIASLCSAFLGGPANTTYGENTGVIGMTRIASVSVIRNAALIAIALSFLGKLLPWISTIPNAVLGGMSILLYGVIASNGLKVLIKERVDFGQMRNPNHRKLLCWSLDLRSYPKFWSSYPFRYCPISHDRNHLELNLATQENKD